MIFFLSLLYWISFFLLLFTWIFYLIFLYLIKLITVKNEEKLNYSYQPRISFIIAAHNEEAEIAERIKNILALDYPKELIEVIVASDGSTDNTNEIVINEFGNDSKVKLLAFEGRRGRAYIHNESVKEASADLIVFTDSKTRFDSKLLKNLIPYFSDPKVGAVSGRVYYKNTNQSSITESAGIYWKYEELIRKLESDIGVLSFGTGAGLARVSDQKRSLHSN